MAVMIDLRGSSANTENLLRIRSEPANYYIYIVVRSFYHNKVKFDFYTTLLHLKILCSIISLPCGKGSKQQD